jgi:hypothetical protein
VSTGTRAHKGATHIEADTDGADHSVLNLLELKQGDDLIDVADLLLVRDRSRLTEGRAEDEGFADGRVGLMDISLLAEAVRAVNMLSLEVIEASAPDLARERGRKFIAVNEDVA